MKDSGHPTIHELSQFLANYSSALMGAGANCMRLTMNISRIASTYGMDVEVQVLARHINLTVWEKDSTHPVTTICRVSQCGISYNLNSHLSRLSWMIADGKIDFDTAKKLYKKIISEPAGNKWLTLLLVTLANASFCRLFGGDAIAMCVVAMATCIGYYLKLVLLAYHTDVRVLIFICSFISTIIGATDALFSLGTTPMIAIGTSVLYLVPGIPFLNSFSDFIARHYLCSIGRFCDALVSTCCLSIGLCLGMYIMGIGMF